VSDLSGADGERTTGAPVGSESEAPTEEGPAISGVVTDFDEVPLVGVRVEASTTSGEPLDLSPALTDSEGRFVLSGLPEGRYDLRFVLGQVRARTLAVPVGTDQLRVRLARPHGILLKVRTASGQPPPDVVHVVLERETPLRYVREHIGRTLKPRLLLWSIRPGRYNLTAWGGAYLPVQVQNVSVEEGKPAPEVDVCLDATGGTVNGLVRRGAEGRPTDAMVAWRRLDRPSHVPRHASTLSAEADGTFRVRGLPTGRYVFSAYREGVGLVDREIDVTEDGATDVEMRLP
jgi:hypothetical protein